MFYCEKWYVLLFERVKGTVSYFGSYRCLWSLPFQFVPDTPDPENRSHILWCGAERASLPCRGALCLRYNNRCRFQHPGESKRIRASIPPAQWGRAHVTHADLCLSWWAQGLRLGLWVPEAPFHISLHLGAGLGSGWGQGVSGSWGVVSALSSFTSTNIFIKSMTYFKCPNNYR